MADVCVRVSMSVDTLSPAMQSMRTHDNNVHICSTNSFIPWNIMYLFCVLCYLLIPSIRQTKSRLRDNDYIIMIALQWRCQHALFKQTTIWQQLPSCLGREGCVCEQKLVSHLACRLAIQHNLWAIWLATYSSVGLLRKHAFQKIFFNSSVLDHMGIVCYAVNDCARTELVVSSYFYTTTHSASLVGFVRYHDQYS